MMTSVRWLTLVFLIGCAASKPQPTTPTGPGTSEPVPVVVGKACDPHQADLLKQADERAKPYSTEQHLAKNFADGKVSWLMKDTAYQNYVVKPAAKNWGRCDDTGCYVFVAPAAKIHEAVEKSMASGHHDPAALGKALGLPAANFEGTLRMMTFDLTKDAVCARLPVDTDPGAYACKSADDTDCFKFGGYTSGGTPELMLINVPVAATQVDEVN
ncbi:MAG TPA: hypothetical protein VFP84_41000 [Kofleriaceae bacterium]|nr:hypothetical protein [Kofleriaceae bacterium]